MNPDDSWLKTTGRYVFFPQNACPFSNSYPAVFYYGIMHMRFFCADQFFAYFKASTFEDAPAVRRIMLAKSASECIDIGRNIENYDDTVWNAMKFDVMLEANVMKFSQNPWFKTLLLDRLFDGKIFAETGNDRVWGIGKPHEDCGIDDKSSWNGANLQGKVIGEVRNILMRKPAPVRTEGRLNGYIVI